LALFTVLKNKSIFNPTNIKNPQRRYANISGAMIIIIQKIINIIGNAFIIF